MVELEVIGGGRMGEALVGGMLAAGRDPATVRVVARHASRRAELERGLAGVEIAEVPLGAPSVMLAVKPNDIAESCRSLADQPAPERVLSIAAGVTTAFVESSLGDRRAAVIRAMPNTPALVGAGVTAIAPGSAAGDGDLDWAEALLAVVGSVVRVTESQLDAVTGLSGSGPAYVFLVIESLVEAGVLAGLARDVATELAIGTVGGAAALAAAGDRPPALLRADVTSPGGTTAAGLRVLEQQGVRAALIDAVVAAAERSRQLGS
ncbi:MAG: pyrroline-5-carboxylate reductase [Actinomycetota bacterium]|nr:pyrroline-5-carboxylate reductase [Actinomycetota bacterium]